MTNYMLQSDMDIFPDNLSIFKSIGFITKWSATAC